jgi:hypothetical protein
MREVAASLSLLAMTAKDLAVAPAVINRTAATEQAGFTLPPSDSTVALEVYDANKKQLGFS